MKFPLIKRADDAEGEALDRSIEQNGVDKAVEGLREEQLESYYLSYRDFLDYKEGQGASEEELARIGKNLNEIERILANMRGAKLQAPVATPAAPNKAEAPKKTGPHAGMKLVQEKFNAFLEGKNFSARVPVNGNQGDSTTWKVMQGVFPEWFAGGVKFKNYKQLASWLDAKMKEVSGSPAAESTTSPALQRGAGKGRELVAAWRNFLSAYPYAEFNPDNIVYKTFFTGEPGNVAAKASAFASDINYAKIPVKEFAEQAAALLGESLVGEAIKKLNEGTAAAKAAAARREKMRPIG